MRPMNAYKDMLDNVLTLEIFTVHGNIHYRLRMIPRS
jgi:hypothetical protein